MKSAGSTSLVSDLRAGMKGRVITPDDPGYDEARALFMGGFDPRPAVIARPSDAAGVATVIRVARVSGLPFAVRCGGHSGAGHSTADGGIVLDVRDMQAIEIDPQARTAWAQTGLTAADYSMVSRPVSAIRVRSASAASRLPAVSGTSCASTASRSTACRPPKS